ncbi:carbamoyltransferase family protein [Halopelagius longus]|nr:carbamoyltransferase C-terminal domain-containing protein [Halopelagius longus]SDR17175.1 carbamoyltransferase [Halopelagius longus]
MTEALLSILSENVDPSAALFLNGELIAIGEEERFSRAKHAYNEFPIQAIKYCLDEGAVTFRDVDLITYGWDANKYPLYMAKKYLDGWQNYDKDQRTLEWEKSNLESKNPDSMTEKIKQELLSEFGGPIPPIKFLNHHRAHAAAAYYGSGFESAAVLTTDGHGEENAVVGWKADNTGLTEVFTYEIPHSLGWFYASITAFLGFKPNNGEGKVMGLAPYGEETESIRSALTQVLEVNDEGFSIDPSFIFYGEHNYHERFTDQLVEVLGEPRQRDAEITQFHRNIAHTAQNLLQEALETCAESLLEQTGETKLCLAGGVGYNCKANMHLRESLDLDDFFVHPLSGEAGIPLGAGHLFTDLEVSPRPLQHVYYGWEPSEDQVKKAINSHNIEICEEGEESVRKKMVTLLSEGNIIARYSGRMECGPRALGNRSILADPRNTEMVARVNEATKRENWRPFAPSILKEYADNMLKGEIWDPFMIQTYQVKEEWLDKLAATTHVDNTTRPQILSKQMNEPYWLLIENFREQTGVPALLNTSFNLSGEPIVRTPEEAIMTLIDSEIDYLQIEDYLIQNPTV